jgi:hypothetical protein
MPNTQELTLATNQILIKFLDKETRQVSNVISNAAIDYYSFNIIVFFLLQKHST